MKSTKSLLRRMAKLEVLLPARRTPTAEDERFADAFLRLVERMGFRHGTIGDGADGAWRVCPTHLRL